MFGILAAAPGPNPLAPITVNARRLRVLRNIGLQTRDDAIVWSSNSRLDTIQAAMMLAKLPFVDGWTEARRSNAAAYRAGFGAAAGLVVPEERTNERQVYHTFVIQAEERDELRAHLDQLGIGTAVHYPVPIHLQTIGRALGYGRGDFPVAERQATRILSLPVRHGLTAQERDRVVAGVLDFIESRKSAAAVAR